jgi:hypothetical protein
VVHLIQKCTGTSVGIVQKQNKEKKRKILHGKKINQKKNEGESAAA